MKWCDSNPASFYSCICFYQTEVEGRKVPTLVKALSKFQVVDMVVGPQHSAVVVEPGLVYMFGRNHYGQLGLGNTKPREAPAQVQTMADKIVSVRFLSYYHSTFQIT